MLEEDDSGEKVILSIESNLDNFKNVYENVDKCEY